MTKPKVGPPRFDAFERLRHRLYEPIVFLSLVDPTQHSDATQPSMDVVSSGSSVIWHKFIDSLAWLCDFDTGGQSVSAIGAQYTPQGPKFWLAASSKKSVSHLEKVLAQLESLHEKSSEERKAIENEIVADCIKHSFKKVNNYAKLLRKAFREAPTTDDDILITNGEERPSAALEGMLNRKKDHVELCRLAWQLGDHFKVEKLMRDGIQLNRNSQLPTLRHYVGRLGSWHRAVQLLCWVAAGEPDLLTAFTVQFIELPPEMKAPEPDAKTNLRSALGRMLSADQQDRVDGLEQAVTDLRHVDLAEDFREKYQNPNFRPRIHAELVIMEHFYQNGLEFLGRDKYIGCSKPSCYCCSLYMRYHPGNYTLRPAHGNLWYNWAPPFQMTLESEDARKVMTAVINNMTQHLRRDVIWQIESRMARRDRHQDSSTNISARLFIADI